MKQYFRNSISARQQQQQQQQPLQKAQKKVFALIRKRGIDMGRVDELLNAGRYKEAETALLQGLKQSTNGDEQARISTMLGVYYYYGLGSTPSYKHAIAYFRNALGGVSDPANGSFRAAHAEAFHYLGLMHIQGNGVEPDVDKALEYYHQAAKYGYDESQYKLGMIYKSGKGVQKNENIAFKYFQEAAHQDHPKAQNQLAMMYAAGNGVKKDDKQAVHWYTCAANQGNDIAQYNLGYMYCEGRGVEQNYATANHWFMKVAASNGYGKGNGNGDANDVVHSLI